MYRTRIYFDQPTLKLQPLSSLSSSSSCFSLLFSFTLLRCFLFLLLLFSFTLLGSCPAHSSLLLLAASSKLRSSLSHQTYLFVCLFVFIFVNIFTVTFPSTGHCDCLGSRQLSYYWNVAVMGHCCQTVLSAHRSCFVTCSSRFDADENFN